MQTTLTCTMASEERLERFENQGEEPGPGGASQPKRVRIPFSVYHGHFQSPASDGPDQIVKVTNSPERFVIGQNYAFSIEPA